MILVRLVFHAKQGKVRQFVESMKEMTQNLPNRPRILTDLSGPFNTVVLESKHESLAAYEKWRNEFFSSEESGPEAQADEMFESGSTEYYTIEQE